MKLADKRIAIIGAGIAGLTAAFRLQENGARITVFERDDAAGGRTRTRRDAGFVIDVGAGLLPSTYVDVARLIKDAGLTHLTEPVTGSVAIARDGRLHALDMQRPIASLLATSLLSARSKWRLLRLARAVAGAYRTLRYDTVAGAAALDTESIASFADRELGPEAREYFIEPLTRTLYLHDAEDASIVELLWCLKNLAASSSFALRGGMDSLGRELAKRFDVQYGVEVQSVEPDGDGCRMIFEGGARPPERFDAAIVAADAFDLRRVLGDTLSPAQQNFLDGVRYSTSINLHFRLRAPLDTSSLLIQVPKTVDDSLAVLVQDHLKGSGRTPPGKALVSAFFINPWGEARWQQSDAEIVADAGPRIERVVPGFLSKVEGVHIERWRRAATIGYTGYYKQLAEFEAGLDPNAAIQIASDLFALSSVNVAVCQGERAAARLARRCQAAAASSRP